MPNQPPDPSPIPDARPRPQAGSRAASSFPGTQLSRLDRALFALARGWVQGVELPELAARYLSSGSDQFEQPDRELDPRTARRRLQFVLDELAAAARRLGYEKESALFRRQAALTRTRVRRRPASPLPSSFSSALLPSLEDFALTLGDPEFYSEQELLQLYQAAHGTGALSASIPAQGPSSAASSRSRADPRSHLIRRQLALITEIELRASDTLSPASRIRDWFTPVIGERLTAAGVHTVDDLLNRMSARLHWYREIPAIGKEKAERIEALLEASLGPVPRPLPVIGDPYAVLSERFELLSPLHDSSLARPSPAVSSLIDARTDLEAMNAFLLTRSSPVTKRSYRKEIFRFLLWASRERGKGLSALRVEDCGAYPVFMADPQPSESWCTGPGGRSRNRSSSLWRPFEGPLSSASITTAMNVIQAFWAWLVDVGYVSSNPWKAIGIRIGQPTAVSGDQPPARLVIRRFRERALSVSEWSEIETALLNLPDTGRGRRTRFVIGFLRATGLRISELVSARLHDLIYEPPDPASEDPGGWVLAILGKGQRIREVVLAEDSVIALTRYLAVRFRRSFSFTGTALLPEIVTGAGSAPLLGPVDDYRERAPNVPVKAGPMTGITSSSVYADVRWAMGFVKEGSRAQGVTPHWFRHTFATHSLKAGVPAELVRQALGHASLATTSLYVSPERADRRKAAAALSRMGSSSSPTAPKNREQG